MKRAVQSVTLVLGMLLVIGAAGGSAAASEQAAAGASSEALRIAQTSQAGWRLGRLVAREHAGRRHVEAELLSHGTPIARLRVDPGTGRLLQRGERPVPGLPSIDPAQLRPQIERAIGHLELGTWAWPAEHGRAWAVPVRWEGRLVGAIKIDVRRRRILTAEHDDEDND